jgi:hypothetical protein
MLTHFGDLTAEVSQLPDALDDQCIPLPLVDRGSFPTMG